MIIFTAVTGGVIKAFQPDIDIEPQTAPVYKLIG